MAAPSAPLIHPSRIVNRWGQLIAGIIAMMAIANLQYAWTLFTKPMQAHLHVTLTAIQGIFSLFILLETWLVPFEGYLIDRIGPRLMLGVGAVFVGLGWVFSGRAESLGALYFWYCLGGVGAGIVYGGTIGNALKWFPDHRGLCVGLTAGAYGIGTALTVAPIDKMIRVSGYQHTLIFWGIIQGFVVLAAALFMAKPPAGWAPPNWAEKEAKIKQKVRSSAVDMTPAQMLTQPSFYMIYLMMTMLSFGGLVVTAQLKPMAVSFHVDKVIVLWGMSAMVMAISVDRYLERVDQTVLGLGVGPHRTGKHHVHRLQLGGGRGVCPPPINQPSGVVHRPVGLVLLCLGRNLLPLPLHHGRFVRQEVGDYKLRHRLHGEGNGRAVCRFRRRVAVRKNWVVDQGLLGDDCLRPDCRVHGPAVVETPGHPHGSGFRAWDSSGRP